MEYSTDGGSTWSVHPQAQANTSNDLVISSGSTLARYHQFQFLMVLQLSGDIKVQIQKVTGLESLMWMAPVIPI